MVHVLHFISILHLSQNYEVELHQKCLIFALKISTRPGVDRVKPKILSWDTT